LPTICLIHNSAAGSNPLFRLRADSFSFCLAERYVISYRDFTVGALGHNIIFKIRFRNQKGKKMVV